MLPTSVSLLERLIHQPGDDASWQRLVGIYTPLLEAWVRRHHLQDADGSDVVQNILAVVVRRLPDFRRQHDGAFRAWLRAITVNCLRDYWRSGKNRPRAPGGEATLDELADSASALSQLWDREHDLHVTRQLLNLLKPQFKATTWRAFERVVLEEAAAEDVAAELGLTVNAVFIAKSRVLAKLRDEAKELLE